jgi:hypothetical protein
MLKHFFFFGLPRTERRTALGWPERHHPGDSTNPIAHFYAYGATNVREVFYSDRKRRGNAIWDYNNC